MNIKLAVIIPTYDNLEMLKPLVTQLEGFNVYVIEDGQRKETTNWLKTQRVKSILHTENMGVAVSWNDGLREALKDGCTHFAIINDDVVLPKNWWEDCRKEFENKKVHLVSLNFSGWFFIIDKECVDPNDVETLETLVQTAVNQAVKESQEMVSSAMSKVTGGLSIPGLF